jgi:putative hydrolase
MIDLHSHTQLSDGALNPAEHIRRAEHAGYRILGMSDHADLATLAWIAGILRAAADRENELGRLTVLAGVELTHLRPEHIAEGVARARELGLDYVACHGESLVEPVLSGTNRAAIEAGVDYLAHPGLISLEDARFAAERGVVLEISGRKGHCYTNGHVAAVAKSAGATLMFGSDAHVPSDLPRRDLAEAICRGAGLTDEQVQAMFNRAEQFARGLCASAASCARHSRPRL